MMFMKCFAWSLAITLALGVFVPMSFLDGFIVGFIVYLVYPRLYPEAKEVKKVKSNWNDLVKPEPVKKVVKSFWFDDIKSHKVNIEKTEVSFEEQLDKLTENQKIKIYNRYLDKLNGKKRSSWDIFWFGNNNA